MHWVSSSYLLWITTRLKEYDAYICIFNTWIDHCASYSVIKNETKTYKYIIYPLEIIDLKYEISPGLRTICNGPTLNRKKSMSTQHWYTANECHLVFNGHSYYGCDEYDIVM